MIVVSMTESPNNIWIKITGIWYHIVYDFDTRGMYLDGQCISC